MAERDKFGKFVKGSTIGKSTQFKKGSSGFTGKHSEETKKKISNNSGMRGKKSWNNGLTKKDDSRIKGGRISKGIFIGTDGYAHIYLNKKVIPAHRYLWEKEFGEIPLKHVIHHIDGNKLNNRLENLQLMKISEHTKLHWEQGDIRGIIV